MSEQSNQAGGRRLLVVGICFVTLLLGVAIAWSLVLRRTTRVAEARELLDAVAERGVGAYWPEPFYDWFIISRDDRAVGWRLVAVEPDGNDRFSGLDVIVQPDGQGASMGYWERWLLAGDLSSSMYSAGSIDLRRREARRADTSIVFSEGTIIAEQTVQGRRFESLAPDAPTNYLPEGVMNLARAAAGRRDQRATFAMIVNQVPPRGAEPRFFDYTLRPRGRGEGAGLEDTWEVVGSLQGSTGTCWIDESARMRELRQGSLVHRKAGRDEVIVKFPDARRVLRSVALQASFLPEGGDPNDPDWPGAFMIPSRPDGRSEARGRFRPPTIVPHP